MTNISNLKAGDLVQDKHGNIGIYRGAVVSLERKEDGKTLYMLPSEFELGFKPYKEPFDWKNVKPGMAFETADERIVYYVGPHLEEDCTVIVSTPTENYLYDGRSKAALTRTPEYDIPQGESE